MIIDRWLDADAVHLGAGFPLALDRPFTAAEASAAGVSRHMLRNLTSAGLVRPVLHGVLVPSQMPDDLTTRVRSLALVLSPDVVVTGRTAGWLHGMPVLRRGAHLTTPPIEVCHTTGCHAVRPQLDAHRRGLLPRDVTEVMGLPVTTPLRTAMDLGRLLWRFDALSALDAGLRVGVDPAEISLELGRFKGYRGIRQLRLLAPLADGRSESPGESALRLHWLEAGLPAPTPQLWVPGPHRAREYRLDLTLAALKYAGEYDGKEFHGPAQVAHDHDRREFLRGDGWSIDVFGNDDVYGMDTDIQDRLWKSFVRVRRG